jgi:hypothetical protein
MLSDVVLRTMTPLVLTLPCLPPQPLNFLTHFLAFWEGGVAVENEGGEQKKIDTERFRMSSECEKTCVRFISCCVQF